MKFITTLAAPFVIALAACMPAFAATPTHTIKTIIVTPAEEVITPETHEFVPELQLANSGECTFAARGHIGSGVIEVWNVTTLNSEPVKLAKVIVDSSGMIDLKLDAPAPGQSMHIQLKRLVLIDSTDGETVDEAMVVNSGDCPVVE